MARQKLSRRSRAARRYQNTLRVIKRRGKIGHREAQQFYRDTRERLEVRKVQSRIFKEYSGSYFRQLTRRVEKKLEKVLFEGEEEFAFDLADLPAGGKIKDILADKFPKTIRTLKVTIEGFVSGVSEKITTVTRGPISTDEFWTTYYDMVREVLIKLYNEFGKEAAIALIVLKITAI